MPTRYFPLTINSQMAGSPLIDETFADVVQGLPQAIKDNNWLFWAQHGARKVADVARGDITRVYWKGETPIEWGPRTHKAHTHRAIVVEHVPHKTGNVEHHSHYIHLDIRATRDWLNQAWAEALGAAAADQRATPKEADAFRNWVASREPGAEGRPKGVYYFVAKPTSDAREVQRYIEYARKTAV